MNNQATGHSEIYSLLEDWADAIRRKDTDRAMAHYAQGNVQFIFFLPYLQFSGQNEIGKDAVQRWFDGFDGAVGYEIRDLKIVGGDRAAFCHFLNRLSGKRKDAMDLDLWIRVTLGLEKLEGRWLISHAHESCPFPHGWEF